MIVRGAVVDGVRQQEGRVEVVQLTRLASTCIISMCISITMVLVLVL